MSGEGDGSGDGRDDDRPHPPSWPEELRLPELLSTSEKVRSLHAAMDSEWGSLLQTARQTAAGRALWRQVVRDPLAEVLSGEMYLRSLREKMRADHLNNAREVSGVIIAVRTLWFDSKLETAVRSFGGAAGDTQVVLLGAGMDTRAYRLDCLRESSIFEVDFPELLETKTQLLKEVRRLQTITRPAPAGRDPTRVAADVRESDWAEKLRRSGFDPGKSTVWVLEGILCYLPHLCAVQLLRSIAANCSAARTVLLADFMNQSAASLCSSAFHFHCDWPERLLPSLGFARVGLSQIGDPDASFGLTGDPHGLFNRLRGLPRSVQTHPDDGTPCRRLYLVEASGSPSTGSSS